MRSPRQMVEKLETPPYGRRASQRKKDRKRGTCERSSRKGGKEGGSSRQKGIIGSHPWSYRREGRIKEGSKKGEGDNETTPEKKGEGLFFQKGSKYENKGGSIPGHFAGGWGLKSVSFDGTSIEGKGPTYVGGWYGVLNSGLKCSSGALKRRVWT